MNTTCSMYTPGPWTATEDGWVFGANGETIVSHHPMTCIDERILADCQLIAAAPDLLDSCQQLVSAFWGDFPDRLKAGFRKDYPDHPVCRAEAAVAKATQSAAVEMEER